MVGDMSSRPNWGLSELDFVFSTLIVGSILNFSLMYLLAPTAGTAAASTGLMHALFSPETLGRFGAPGGHMFQRGAYNLGQRGLGLGRFLAQYVGDCVALELFARSKKNTAGNR